MHVFESLDAIPEHEFSGGTAVAIGKFDGVHLGHQMLLQRIFDVGAAQGTDPVVFTFANNPLSFLRPELCPEPLMSKAQRLDALAAEGVSSCVMVPFDADLAAVSAEDFVSQVLETSSHRCLSGSCGCGTCASAMTFASVTAERETPCCSCNSVKSSVSALK